MWPGLPTLQCTINAITIKLLHWMSQNVHNRNEVCDLPVVSGRVGRPGLDAQREQGFSSLSPRPGWLWGPPTLISNGYHGLFLAGIKWSKRGDDQSSLRVVSRSSMRGAIPPRSLYLPWAWCTGTRVILSWSLPLSGVSMYLGVKQRQASVTCLFYWPTDPQTLTLSF
jgi:hypothetical protein